MVVCFTKLCQIIMYFVVCDTVIRKFSKQLLRRHDNLKIMYVLLMHQVSKKVLEKMLVQTVNPTIRIQDGDRSMQLKIQHENIVWIKYWLLNQFVESQRQQKQWKRKTTPKTSHIRTQQLLALVAVLTTDMKTKKCRLDRTRSRQSLFKTLKWNRLSSRQHPQFFVISSIYFCPLKLDYCPLIRLTLFFDFGGNISWFRWPCARSRWSFASALMTFQLIWIINSKI